jgi:hypothetical protein
MTELGEIAMSIHLAGLISAKAEEALANLEEEMAIRKWPADLRAIMWEAVAAVASIRAREARETGSRT